VGAQVDVAVETQGLTRTYGAVKAVSGLDLKVPRGILFALLGPNGAGKSTTIRILTTLLEPTSGRALVCGQDVVKQARSVRGHIGVVFQEVSLDDRLTAMENLMLHAAVFGIPSRERKSRAEAKLEWVGLSSSAGTRVRALSGGMRRRLEIARALLHEPAVLILDEPTVGLDPQTRRAVWDHLAQLASKERTVFVTTHYMDEAERCDDVAVIDHGALIARGSPAELMKHASAERLVVRAEDHERVVETARALGFSAKIADDRVEVEGDRADVMLARLAEKGLGLREVAIVKPRLEDAFVALTGRDLRDDQNGGAGAVEAMRARVKHRGA
jgi:ABC-2 type transport system ATP-binding protein